MTTSSQFRPTIFALSTVPGKSAVAVVRVSGSESSFILKELTSQKAKIPKERCAAVRKLHNSKDKRLLDDALVLLFKEPKSFTGEDCLEFHLHGGIATINKVLASIKELNDQKKGRYIRYAEPGEFTRRAYQNGKLDLTEVEGIRDVIDAETETQRVAAINSMDGYNKKYFNKMREQILRNTALLSAVVDFGEDYGVDEVGDMLKKVGENISILNSSLQEYLYKSRKIKILLNGIKVTLLGPTNAGKSSLLNKISNKDTAIVSNIAGTTRDIISFPLDINGYKVIIGDTAGIRDTNDTIELEGIKRAKNNATQSDMILAVIPADFAWDLDDKLEKQQELLFIKFIKERSQTLSQKQKMKLIINKVDLRPKISNLLKDQYSTLLNIPVNDIITISCKTNEGIEELMEVLTDEFQKITESTNSADIASVSERAQDIIENDIMVGFQDFFEAKENDDIVMACEALKLSVNGISKITGEAIGVEEMLGVIFSTFCIGK